jgi:hypothetical protein
MAKLAALAAALLLNSPSALAWGGLGHEAMCELAFRELDDSARQRVIALIRQDPEFPHVSRVMQLGRPAAAACARALRQSPARRDRP